MHAQDDLFYESLNDALSALIDALGGKKKVAGLLWPTEPITTAHDRLRACLNEGRREHFHPNDVVTLIRMGRDAGCHSVLRFICQYCGYADPVPLEPRDEIAALQREFILSVKRQQQLADKIERVMGQAPVRAVR